MQNKLTISILTLSALLLSACGGHHYKDGAPAHRNIDFNAIPDAEPKPEPYSRYGNPEKYEVFGKTYYPLKSNKISLKRVWHPGMARSFTVVEHPAVRPMICMP